MISPILSRHEKAFGWTCAAFSISSVGMIVGLFVGCELVAANGRNPELGGAAYMMGFGPVILVAAALLWLASVVMMVIGATYAPVVMRTRICRVVKLGNWGLFALWICVLFMLS